MYLAYTACMKNADQQSTQPRIVELSQNDSWLRKTLKVVMFPVAGISGYWVAAQSVYNSAYNNAKDHGLFNTPSKEKVEEYRRTDKRPSVNDKQPEGVDRLVGERGQRLNRLAGNARNIVESIVMGEPADIITGASQINKEVDAKVAERMKAAGLGSTRKRWKYLRNDQKHAAAAEFMTIAGIAAAGIGAVLSLTENRRLAKLIDKQEEEKNAGQGGSRGAA